MSVSCRQFLIGLVVGVCVCLCLEFVIRFHRSWQINGHHWHFAWQFPWKHWKPEIEQIKFNIGKMIIRIMVCLCSYIRCTNKTSILQMPNLLGFPHSTQNSGNDQKQRIESSVSVWKFIVDSINLWFHTIYSTLFIVADSREKDLFLCTAHSVDFPLR